MAEAAETMKAGIWFDRHKYEEAEYKYQEYLVSKKSVGQPVEVVSKPKVAQSVEVVNKPKANETSGGNLSQRIKEARQKMTDLTVGGTAPADADSVKKQVDLLTKENETLRDAVAKMTKRFEEIESRLSALERSSVGDAPQQKAVDQKPVVNGTAKDDSDDDDDDDDVDLFGSDDEEEDEEAAKIREERLKAYHEKKAKKAAVIAKSNIVLDVKPWDDETNMAELEKCVRSVEMDGLLWGASKLVKIAFGIMKLQITCVVEDDKVSTDELEERITAFDDYIQSVDIAAFNKI